MNEQYKKRYTHWHSTQILLLTTSPDHAVRVEQALRACSVTFPISGGHFRRAKNPVSPHAEKWPFPQPVVGNVNLPNMPISGVIRLCVAEKKDYRTGQYMETVSKRGHLEGNRLLPNTAFLGRAFPHSGAHLTIAKPVPHRRNGSHSLWRSHCASVPHPQTSKEACNSRNVPLSNIYCIC